MSTEHTTEKAENGQITITVRPSSAKAFTRCVFRDGVLVAECPPEYVIETVVSELRKGGFR